MQVLHECRKVLKKKIFFFFFTFRSPSGARDFQTPCTGDIFIIMNGWPHLFCKPSMMPPCLRGIQKLHIHWRYPSGSGIYSHKAGTSRPLRVDSEAIGVPLWCCLPWCHHRVTWIPLWCICHLPNSEIFIAPEQYIFHSNCEHHYKDTADDPDCQDWENNGTICDSMCATPCRLLVIGVKYVLPFSTTRVSGLVYPAHWYGRWSSVHLTHVSVMQYGHILEVGHPGITCEQPISCARNAWLHSSEWGALVGG